MEELLKLLKQIKAYRRGTLVIITGREGSGKTTLAIKLMDYLDNAGVLLRDDVVFWDSKLTDACKLAHWGYIPIITPTDLYMVPKEFRGVSKDGVRSLLVIHIISKGKFKATYSFFTDDYRILFRTLAGEFSKLC